MTTKQSNQPIVSKTSKDARQLAQLFRNVYMNVNGFQFNEIRNYLKDQNISHNIVYNMLKAGVIVKLSRGVFALNKQDFIALTDAEIAMKVEDMAIKSRVKARKLRLVRKASKNMVDGLSQMQFQKAVELIKSMGGKVLMPTSEYKEI